MNKQMKQCCIIAMIALIGFSFSTCGDGAGGGGPDPTVVHYLSTAKAGFTIDGADAEGTQFILELAKSPASRAVYTPQVNDTYEMAMRGTDGTVQTFTGNVVSYNNGFVTLDCGDGLEISVNITGGDMTGFSGFLPLAFGDGSKPIPIVGELSPYKMYFPDGPGAPDGKTWDDYVREAFEEGQEAAKYVIAEKYRGNFYSYGSSGDNEYYSSKYELTENQYKIYFRYSATSDWRIITPKSDQGFAWTVGDEFYWAKDSKDNDTVPPEGMRIGRFTDENTLSAHMMIWIRVE